MKYADQSQKPKVSLGKFAFQAIIVLILGFFIYLTAITFKAQKLDDINGYGASDKTRAPNLLRLLETSVKSERLCVIKEEELNRYFKERIKLSQDGFLSDKLKLRVKGFGARVEDGQLELIIEREVMGYSHTVSMFLKTQTKNNEQGRPVLTLERTGARLGNQTFPPVYALLVQNGFQTIQKKLKKELELAFGSMSSIRFLDGKIELDPRPVELTPANRGNS